MMFGWFREWERRRRFRKLMILQRAILLWSALNDIDRSLKASYTELEAQERQPIGDSSPPKGPIPNLRSSVVPPSNLNIPMPPGAKSPNLDRKRVDRYVD